MNDTIAVYQGKKYSADWADWIQEEDIILLRSTDEQEVEEKGFEVNERKDSLYKGFKYVSKEEVTEFYREYAYVQYKGHRWSVFAEDGDKLLIEISNLEPEEMDRMEIDFASDACTGAKWVNKDEVTIEIERRSLL